METQLGGMTALITGASGGIGWAAAEALADEGCNLGLVAGTRLEQMEAAVGARPWRDRATCVAADVRAPQDVRRAVEAVAAEHGRIDICVVSAGTWPPDSWLLHEMAEARIEDVLTTNLLGAVWTCRAFMEALGHAGARADGRGASICLIGSTAGRFGEAGHCPYATAKAGLYGLVRSLKNEVVQLDPYARVNMVEPGWTATEMASAALARPGAIESTVRTMPLRQIARAVDIARSVVFLSSPGLARHLSGEVLTVAGGMEGRVQWAPSDVDAAAVRARLDET